MTHSKTTPPDPIRRNVYWLTFQFLFRIFVTLWLRFRARGIERVPFEGGGLVLVNHQSFLDPLLVGAPLSRPISYLARDSLFRVPVVGWILRNMYVMPIRREAATSSSIKEAVSRLQEGFLVGIFPEGTRHADGAVGQFKPGFLALLKRGKRPVYPVGIAGAGQALPRSAWFIRPRKVRVVFGQPLEWDEIEPHLQQGTQDRLIDLARNRVVQCQREAEEWLRR